MICKDAIGADCYKCCRYCDKKHNCDDVCDLCNSTGECKYMINESEMTELQVMQSAIPDALKEITSITIEKKKLEEKEKMMREKLLVAMEKNNIKKFENEFVSFTYMAPTTRNSVDSKKLKEKHPDIYDECLKTSKVSASVKIAVK